MKVKVYIFSSLLFIMILLDLSWGYTFLEKTFFGDRVHTIDVRSLGMGNTGFASGAGTFSMNKNPALLSDLPLLDFAFAGQALVNLESRSFPAHGYGMEFVADNVYAENINYYDDYALGVTVNPSIKYAPAIAIAYMPLYDLRYEYVEEVRGIESPYEDELIGRNTVSSDGNLMGFSIGLSKDFLGFINLGMAYQYMLGNRDMRIDVDYFVDSENIINEFRINNLKGNQFKFGLLAKPHKRFALGLVYNFPAAANAKLEYKFVEGYSFYPELGSGFSSDVEVRYPGSFGIGIEYRPRTSFLSRLNVDCEFTFWENAKVENDNGDEVFDLNFENTVELRGGVEHILYNQIPLRFGFHIVPEYTNNDITTTYFDLGTAFSFSYFQLGISLEYGSKEYAEMDFFPDGDLYGAYGGSNRESKDKVKVRELRILFNLNAVKK